MTPQVKQRIEQIRRGEVPEGYKRTKAGVAPVEWEEVRIGDVLTQRKTLQCVSVDAPLLSFTIEEGVIDPADKKSNKRDFLIKDMATKKFALTEVGDIIYNPANLKFGAIHRNNLRRGVVSPIYGIFHGEQDSVFMGYLLHNQRFIDYAKVYTEGTVEKLKTLKADTFLKLKITLPSLTEQHKIVEILETQDKFIDLQSKKIEQLKKLKQSCVQRMFPKKGAKLPELRFEGFTDAWEQRKLGDVGTTYTGLSGKTKDDFGHGEGKFITYMNVFSNPISSSSMVEPIEIDESQNEVWIGDVFFTTSSETPEEVGMSSVLLENEGKTYLNSFCFGYRPSQKFDNYYLAYMLRSPNVRKKIVFLAQGISRYNISKNKVMEIEIPIPSYDEQREIGLYFRHLDNLITLHEHKLDKIKKQKETLMQLLLTGIVRVDI